MSLYVLVGGGHESINQIRVSCHKITSSIPDHVDLAGWTLGIDVKNVASHVWQTVTIAIMKSQHMEGLTRVTSMIV